MKKLISIFIILALASCSVFNDIAGSKIIAIDSEGHFKEDLRYQSDQTIWKFNADGTFEEIGIRNSSTPANYDQTSGRKGTYSFNPKTYMLTITTTYTWSLLESRYNLRESQYAEVASAQFYKNLFVASKLTTGFSTMVYVKTKDDEGDDFWQAYYKEISYTGNGAEATITETAEELSEFEINYETSYFSFLTTEIDYNSSGTITAGTKDLSTGSFVDQYGKTKLGSYDTTSVLLYWTLQSDWEYDTETSLWETPPTPQTDTSINQKSIFVDGKVLVVSDNELFQ
ncbi:MAG: hypothetical protein JXR63_06190 [Spirochaetales bacterium]|nr:hypothetical protein [Spirochaetales bacterium]